MNADIPQAVKQDLQESKKWVKEAEPILSELLNGWRLLTVEGKSDDVSKILDNTCGIDYLLYSQKTSNVYGLASRVQYGRNYRTFTVRQERETGAKTEYSKRHRAFENGSLSPYYTMQMYVTGDCISGLGLVKTKDLMKFIEKGLAAKNKTSEDKIGQAQFYVCQWDDLRSAGYIVKEYRK